MNPTYHPNYTLHDNGITDASPSEMDISAMHRTMAECLFVISHILGACKIQSNLPKTNGGHMTLICAHNVSNCNWQNTLTPPITFYGKKRVQHNQNAIYLLHWLNLTIVMQITLRHLIEGNLNIRPDSENGHTVPWVTNQLLTHDP